MTVASALANVKTVLDGVIADTYIWPHDYAAMASVPSLPMLVIQEAPATEQIFAAMAFRGPTSHTWSMRIEGYVSFNLPTVYPSPELATVEALTGTLMVDIYNELKSNVPSLGVFTFGDATGSSQPMFWNLNKRDGTKSEMNPSWGFVMIVPFTEDIE